MVNRKVILLLFSFAILGLQSQPVDSSLIRKYPYRIGHIGFAVDSMEFYGGRVARGETIDYTLGLYNFGKKPIAFKDGKSDKFTEIRFEPSVLQPGQGGKARISYEVISEVPVGATQHEIAIESDDSENPFKFLYMIVDVMEGKTDDPQAAKIIDSVPRLIFNHYNYDFGYTWHGKSFTHRFLYSNMGSKELIIYRIIPTNGCKILNEPVKVVPPGGTGSIVVKVKTFGSSGVQHLMIHVHSNDPRNPVIVLGMHGSVRQHAPSKKKSGFCYR